MSARYSLMQKKFFLEAPDVDAIAKKMPFDKSHFPYPRDDDPSQALRDADPEALRKVLARPEVTAWTLQSLGGQGLALAGLIRIEQEWRGAFSYPIHRINAGVIPRRDALLGVVNHAFGEGDQAVQMLVHPGDRNGHRVARGAGFHIMELASEATQGFDQLVLPAPETPLSEEELGGMDKDAAIATYLKALNAAQIEPLDSSR